MYSDDHTEEYLIFQIADLISELGDKVRDVPKNLDSVINSLSRQAATRDQLVSMRPLDKKIKSLKNEEIPALEKALDKTEKVSNDTKISSLLIELLSLALLI